MKFKSVVLAAGFLVFGAMRPNSLSKEDVMAGGALVAGLLGSYLLYSWITYKTDQQVIQEAEELCQTCDTTYDQLRVLRNRFWLCFEDSSQDDLITFLEEVAIKCMGNTHYNTYAHRLHDMISKLSASLSEGKKRIEQLKNDPEQRLLLERAGAVFELVQRKHDSLRAISQWLDKHAAYFRLRTLYIQLQQRYARALSVAYQLPTNPYLIDALAHEIKHEKQFEGSKYLYLDFYEQLSKDCKEFIAAINALTRSYGSLQEDAIILHQWLDFLALSVASSSRLALENYYKHTTLIDQEMETLARKQRDLMAAHSRAITHRDVLLQQRLLLELEAITRQMNELAAKKKQLDERLYQSSNSFAFEYRNAL